jgi:hypothetical protein
MKAFQVPALLTVQGSSHELRARLTASTYQQWLSIKLKLEEATGGRCSDSAFLAHLVNTLYLQFN